MENNKNLNTNNNAGTQPKICVVDLGNYSVKAINEEGKEIVFQSNISRDTESYPDAFQYILMDSEYTFFEKGVFSKEYIKTSKGSYVNQLLYSISRLYENEDILEINLIYEKKEGYLWY